MDAITVLMERDGISKDEAEALVKETLHEMREADMFEAEEIWIEATGLEPDYYIEYL